MSELKMSPNDVEAKLITHAIQQNEIHKLYLKGVTPNKMLVWGEVLEFIVEYEKQYNELPNLNTVALKHSDFPDITPDNVTVDFLSDVVIENYKKKELRETIESAVDKMDNGSSSVINYLTSRLSEIGTSSRTRATFVDSDPEERLQKYIDKQNQMKEGKHVGLPTGINRLDETLMGYLEGDLVVVTGPPEVGKCLTGDTLISTESGLVRIDGITSEHRVISYDEENNQFVYQNAELLCQGRKPVLELITRRGKRIRLTENHPLLTTVGWKPLSEIQSHEKIAVPMIRNLDMDDDDRYSNELDWETFEAVNRFPPEETYDLSLPNHHNFVANDILVHNSWLLLKSSLVAYMAGYSVLFISLEMIEEEVTLRWHTMAGKEFGHTLPNEGLMSGRGIDVDDYGLFLRDKLGDRREFVVVDDVEGGRCTVSVVEGLIREFRPKLVLIDSLPLMTAADGGMAVSWQGILDVAYGLKFLATRTHTVIMATTLSDSGTFDRNTPAEMGELGLGRYLAYAVDLGVSISESREDKMRNARVFKKRKGKEIPEVFSIAFDPNRGVIG